jgi:membrane-associated phospholipid phosphatase
VAIFTRMVSRGTTARRARVLALLAAWCWPRVAAAQIDVHPADPWFWIAAGGVVAAAALLDERARRGSLAHRSRTLDDMASAGNALGTGRNLIAALAVTYATARLTKQRRVADAVLRVAAGYAVSNAIVGLLKPVAGRHRPDSTNDAWRFHPLNAAGTFHSLPSSHAVHAFSLAAGAALVSDRAWVAAAGYSAAGVVAWSRVYDDQHWGSDVAVSAVIGIASAATTIRWLDRRFPRSAYRGCTPPTPRSESSHSRGFQFTGIAPTRSNLMRASSDWICASSLRPVSSSRRDVVSNASSTDCARCGSALANRS